MTSSLTALALAACGTTQARHAPEGQSTAPPPAETATPIAEEPAPIAVPPAARPSLVCEEPRVYTALWCWPTPEGADHARHMVLISPDLSDEVDTRWVALATHQLDESSDRALAASMKARIAALDALQKAIDARLPSAPPDVRACLLERRADGQLDLAATIANANPPPALDPAAAAVWTERMREYAAAFEAEAVKRYHEAASAAEPGPPNDCAWRASLRAAATIHIPREDLER